MISQHEFRKFIEKIEAMTMTISKDLERRSLVIEEWYNRFGNTDYFLFSKAIDVLIDSYGLHKFPKVSDMYTAIEGARNSIPIEKEPEQAECPKCFNQGLEIVPEKGSSGRARPCSCPLGLPYKKSFSIQSKRDKR
jgi:hypothetical protein